MAKYKNKAKKKNFFGDIKNRGKVFKKEVTFVKPKVAPLRERGRYALVDDYNGEGTHCSHGPCLLFHDKKEGVRYFACAVYRDHEKCPFRALLNEDGTITKVSEDDVVEVPSKYPYGVIPKKMKEIPIGSKIVYCPSCIEIFENKHKHPGEFVKRNQLRRPSSLLEEMSEEHGMAQYFFSSYSLSFVSSLISSLSFDGVLCIGSPRLFENLRCEKKDDRNLFMLDWDQRYLSFFHAKESGRYSMLTDFFPDPKTLSRINSFFSQVNKLVIVCDPPFGVMVEVLVKNIEKMRERHRVARAGSPSSSQSILFLPLFVGKHALKSYNGELWMSDYRVCYDNHKDFAKESKTTVRMFTDIPKLSIDLSNEKGYKLCEMCEKWVSETNKHCGLCGDCTSRDGQTYHHCERCMRCVKDSYIHCKKCTRCHLNGRCPIEVEKKRIEDIEKLRIWEEREKQREERERERLRRERMERFEKARYKRCEEEEDGDEEGGEGEEESGGEGDEEMDEEY